MPTPQYLSNFIWQIADLLRGPYLPRMYERVMLPLTVLRRFDCVLEGTKGAVLAAHEAQKDRFEGKALDSFLNNVAGQRFHNRSPLTFEKLKGDSENIDKHLQSYIDGFSTEVRRIFEYFEFSAEIEKMRSADILYKVVTKFCEVDLHPTAVDNIQMGLLFEDLIRRFNEQGNETAGDHFTPREVIRLMVDILFAPDSDLLATPGTVRTMLDPACGTGGMLSEAQNYLDEHHAEANLYVFGQDFNDRAYAIAASDLLIKGHEHSKIEFGDTLTRDKFPDDKFSYFLANPPFGVDWKQQQATIKEEHEKRGFAGRFGAGLPRVNDGSLLFLQHMMSKFEAVDADARQNGSRLGIVFSGSPLFSGGAGSGESEIRKWIIERDWLETIIALPEQMFYNTGIGTYVWIVTNRKEAERKGKIQLLDARERWKPGASADTRRSLGDKRRHMGADDISAVVREYAAFAPTAATTKLFDNADFGYMRVTVERPLRLRFQITPADAARFGAAHPLLEEDVEAIKEAFGDGPHLDWNLVEACIAAILKGRGSKWKATETKLFRATFAVRDPDAAPVVVKREPLRAGKEIAEADRFAGWFLRVADSGRSVPKLDDLALFRHPEAAARVRFECDPDLRDFENIPLKEDVNDYFRREVLPHVPDAWMDREKDKVGYEINFNRHFYKYTPPRPLEIIDAELKAAEDRILHLLREVTE